MALVDPTLHASHEYMRRARVDFSVDDDDHLIAYIALKVPTKDDGGRIGNKIYEDLDMFSEHVRT